MSCEYCENLSSYRLDRERGSGFEAANNRSTFADIAKDKETGTFYLELDDGDGACFEIEFCPKCGRKLGASNDTKQQFPCNLEIPVPMGGTVWSFSTDCCCACYTKKERHTEVKCDFKAPCHTYITSVHPVILKYNNLSEILEEWGTRFFYTKNEAEDAAEELIVKHRARMKELGYNIDADGKIVNFESELRDDE